MRIKEDIIDHLVSIREKGIENIDEWMFDSALYKATRIMKLINKYAEKHGEVALSVNSEWLYQDDKGQSDAISLVADILEELAEYTDLEE